VDLPDVDGTDLTEQADEELLRKLRPAHGPEEGRSAPFMRVRIPRLQDYQAIGGQQKKPTSRSTRSARSAAATWREDGRFGSSRRAAITHLQVREAEDHRGEMPGVLGRRD